MILLVQKSENCCHLDVHPKSQPRNVLKMFLVFQDIEPIVLINVFLYKKRSVSQSIVCDRKAAMSFQILYFPHKLNALPRVDI